MNEITGPVGFQHIESAPKDGTYVRLRFRPGLGRENWETVARWLAIEEMPAGGWWFDRDDCYVSPGPLFWAPYKAPPGYTQYTNYRP